ncbi:ABC-three component system protein [Mesocricetibacter intestinalis]|uniref:ABC-three component system protein n=1 Tax=Mesocricetibacter intestinalis TaxID=1521930 RepID=UPI00105EDF94|nr:ABC-three component system protein [Mesocricetibacter intestinalis]
MYQYFDLDDSRFENLVIAICKEILGQGVQGFSVGRDDGRDGEFDGKANLYPSQQQAWDGKVIIQAKWTSGINKHYTDSDFYSEEGKSNLLAKELIKVKSKVENGELNYYMLFANRSLTGGAKPIIINYISEKTGLNPENIAIFGNDDLDYYLSRYPYIVNMENINLEPLNIAPTLNLNSLSEVIGHLSKVFDDKNIGKNLSPIIRTSYEKKNKLNNLTDEMAKQLKKYYMKYVFNIKDFLNDPQNTELLNHYQNTVEEFQFNYILPMQSKLEYFDEIFNDLVKYLTNRDYILATNTRLTRMMVFYMYWNCDIGKSNDDSSE